MKNLFKIISSALVPILLASSLFACDSADTGSVDSSADSESTVAEVVPGVEKKDYGDSLYLTIQPNSNHFDYYWVEESSNDAMSEAVFARQQEVYDYLGVEIIGTEALGHDQYGTPFSTAVKNKDGSVDVLLSHAYMSLANFISGGYLTDYNDMDSIDLNAAHWNTEIMEEVAAGDHLYLGYSDYRLAYTHLITFNKEMMDKYSDTLDETPYEMVRNYHWTIDKMISLANLVYTDTTSNGKSDDDIFGITGVQWVPFITFLHASNINLVDENEKGDYVVSVYNDLNRDKTVALIEKLHALSKSDSAWFKYKTDPVKVIDITANQSLLSLAAVTELPGYLDSDVDFGVLPYPMYNENQKDIGYRSLDWGGWICIPSYMRNSQMTGETLEALSYFSNNVRVTYYEKLLGKQVADVPDDRSMLDIIWNGVCSDIGLTYSHISGSLDNNLYMLPTVTQANATEQVASYVSSYENTANKMLRRFFTLLNSK